MTICLELVPCKKKVLTRQGCDIEGLSSELESIGLNPDINTTVELREAIESAYGRDMLDHILEINPSLKLDFPIDGKTIKWLKLEMDNSGINRYVFTPFYGSTDVLIADLFGKYNSGYQDAIPIFTTSKQFDRFKQELHENRDLYIEIFRTQYDFSLEDATLKFDDFFNKYTENGQVGLPDITHERPVIHVVGHGEAGLDSIAPTPNMAQELYSFEVVDRLLKAGLPPKANIKLDFCWSACEFRPSGLTKAEALEKIQLGKADEIFGDIEASFLASFHEELIERVPDFSGEIYGYRGTVLTGKEDGVLTLDGPVGRYFATEITLEDGVLKIKKEDMEVKYVK